MNECVCDSSAALQFKSRARALSGAEFQTVAMAYAWSWLKEMGAAEAITIEPVAYTQDSEVIG